MKERKRIYLKRERARSEEATREKIVEATMHLHEELGPRATSISAIAKRAGVQRLTVYRYFPDETSVFQACTAHWLSLNPPPDPESWAEIESAEARFRASAAAFYSYFTRTRRMWTMSHHDVAFVPALQKPMSDFSEFLDSVCDTLITAFDDTQNRDRIAATIRHALRFTTWSSLDEQGLDDEGKLDLACTWLRGARGV
ncbi:TetR/AcrR family transcriptional regulator [Nisaea sediminum]|uniref:TetR/AcrR family transcriptional regulator n=1 Tax=Nisaea sediminum TaxID=2775867 RepID=UPI001866C73C|nr:TetR/AcrR family transcriptional regulator [Nisaea sediminum]